MYERYILAVFGLNVRCFGFDVSKSILNRSSVIFIRYTEFTVFLDEAIKCEQIKIRHNQNERVSVDKLSSVLMA